MAQKKKNIFKKTIAIKLLLILLFQIVFPTASFALTGGPSQPEVESFTPVGTSDMVDLASGNFNYNIPLMDVEGYPINISYNSGITMDQEATCVGLGWNLNVGALTRSMRGLPDDFKGEEIRKELKYKKNWTVGAGFGLGFEFLGTDDVSNGSLNVGQNIVYNNYTGLSIEPSFGGTLNAGNKLKSPLTKGLGLSLSLRSTETGLTASPSISYSKNIKKSSEGKGSITLGLSINSRQGLKALSLGYSYSEKTTIAADKDKKIKNPTVGGTSSSIDFGYQTYTPNVDMPMRNLSFSASYKMGPTVVTADPTWNVNAYYAEQSLINESVSTNAYGYLYQGAGQMHRDAMLDFNREKDGSFTKFTPHLGLTNFTYDVFSAAGHGVSGSYRPYRSDLGYVYDKEVSSVPDLSFDAGVEIGTGSVVKVGVDVAVNVVQNNSGSWVYGNAASSTLKFADKKTTNSTYEGVYFKQAGEKSVDSDINLYNLIGGQAPVNFELDNASKFNVYAKSKLSSGATITNTNNKRAARQKRNQNFSWLTYDEYEKGAIQPDLQDLIGNGDPNSTTNPAKPHHLAEVSVLRPDGVRYIYGLPAYNTMQKEVSFNISGASVSSDNLVGYLPSDVSVSKDEGNHRGKDNFVSKTTTPAYAHSYMLTSIVSPDYVDVDNNGLSYNDYGSFTKFTYTTKVNNYKWRMPYEGNKANFNEQLKTLNYDDQGSYTYGEKELFYIDKIETKNYVAVFEMADRKDGYGVSGEDGGLDVAPDKPSTPMKLVKSISLYTRPDYYTASGAVNTSAIPIKKVHFVYDYSLCHNVPNNKLGQTLNPSYELAENPLDLPEGTTANSGKLTLKEVYFTYQNSYRAKLNSYKFNYSNINPNYSHRQADRWGCYKSLSAQAHLTNEDFPYAEQNKNIADQNASAWSLTAINLPSGGEIKLEYEADDYAYVQNKKATKMIRLVGMSDNENTTVTPLLLSTPDTDPGLIDNSTPGNEDESAPNIENKNFLYFQKDANIHVSEYTQGISELYFRALVKINNESNGGFEYVSGYAKIKNIFDKGQFGVIELNEVDLGDAQGTMNVNPITKAAIQFGRLHTSQESFNSNPGNPGNTFKEIADFLLVGLLVDVFDMFRGPNRTIYSHGYGREMQYRKSFIKLIAAEGHKYGGDGRISKVLMNDRWKVMTTGASDLDFEYGQEYTYTTKNEKDNDISSGVAAYEPQVGADENALKKPVFFQQHALLAPDDEFYVEEPFGESFYPSPHVTYSKTTVKNISHTNVNATATGNIVNEFYTTKDYPTRSERTYLNPNSTMFEHKSSPIAKLLKFNVRHYLTASQGYSIILNDMDGKQKAQWVYQEGKTTPISGAQYFYKDNGTVNAAGIKTPGNKLNNTATTITKSGQVVQSSTIGVDYDFVADFREHSTDVSNYAVRFNNYGVIIIIPLILPPIWFSEHHEHTQFRSAVATKVIQTYGLLDEVVAYDLGSKVVTKNMAYDAETGEVLLSKVVNEFDDPLFNFSYPAHWAYDGMGPAYKNCGVALDNINVNALPNASSYFVKGDEVLLSDGGTQSKAWVKNVTANSIVLMNASGATVTPSNSVAIKVIRSGRKNQQSVSVGSVAMKDSPLGATQIKALNGNNKIIQASAVQFGDKWKTFCNCGVGGAENEYQAGILGNYRAIKSYLYLTERTQTKFNKNSDVRKDGVFTDFAPFWTPNNGADWSAPNNIGASSKWTFTSEVTEFSPYGFELENKDALNRYSSAVYGYNNTLPISVSANSKFKQSGSDNFEDYDFRACKDDHFSFKTNGANFINTLQSHTGRKSIEVSAGQSIILVKDLNNCINQ